MATPLDRGAARTAQGSVVLYVPETYGVEDAHEKITHARIAERLAALKGFAFAGDYDPSRDYPGPLYFVPSETLIGTETASSLGIASEHDLFGGVVPHAFVATKAITHPLVAPDARAPAGWSHAFGARVRDAVLAGFSAFTCEDAYRAGLRLLEGGPVRLKPVLATGGRGQVVVTDAAALVAALDSIAPEEISRHGLVLEENLTGVTTYSVGQVRVAEIVASYYGTQRLTSDERGADVYGGSDLLVVRGDFEALLGHHVPEEARLAVTQARAYDRAAVELFPGLLASRRNYDVVQGRDTAGRGRSSVLEQSWRIGGASGAEIAALEAFRADPALQVVRAASVENYTSSEVPPRATIYFHGVDERTGFILKYAMIEHHAPDRDHQNRR